MTKSLRHQQEERGACKKGVSAFGKQSATICKHVVALSDEVAKERNVVVHKEGGKHYYY